VDSLEHHHGIEQTPKKTIHVSGVLAASRVCSLVFRRLIMRSKPTIVPDLNLVLDHGRHRVTRGALPPVDLGGNCRLWQVLTELCKRYDSYCSASDLRTEVWEGYLIEEGTLWGAISALRRRLRSLDLTIEYVKGLGYRLKDACDR
jgi:DNA-binding response OmpR family regulator